jgi:D-alanine-D-alanine ligase
MGMNIGVFFGGRSVEHEVSIISALQAIPFFDKAKYEVIPVYITKESQMYVGAALDKIEEYKDIPALLKKSRRVVGVHENGRFFLAQYPIKHFGKSVRCAIDVAFPIVHGTNVEDGALQGYFKMMCVPFAGCDVTASAVGMDKYVTKAVLRDNGIPVLDCRNVYMKSFFKDPKEAVRGVAETIPFPVIVKPLNLGSSVGIKKAFDAEELREALEYSFQYANEALVERAVSPLKEVNCAVLGDRESTIVSECEEPLTASAILGYDDKYVSGGKTKGMSAAKRKFPADIPPEARGAIRDLAQKTFQALRCCGVARVDFLMDASNGNVWVNEINTIPGSLSFHLWEPAGVSNSQLLDRLIELALKRERENAAITYSFETNILARFSSDRLKGAKWVKC